ncbi:hypothetical protein PHMEG_00010044 [Phytophthora megakarya]|uniref:Uncharacterized protein n=1 Tax=Phytophthora megakarya TaxID=4795 RepID=A0A225WH54_9STRA|nr:hypothetical protein PHMEG_00010044 [Phytophthora megakarya]
MTTSNASRTRVTSTIDEKTWVQLHDWADSTTKAWSKQAKAEMRRQHRCEGMSRLRALKKNAFLQMQSEREYLEVQAKKCLATLNESSHQPRCQDSELHDSIHRLALESDSLRTENSELSKKLRQRERFQSIVQDGAFDIFPVDPENNSSSPSVYAASKLSPWVPTSTQYDDGWRVKFQNGEPSFHFHPFSKAEYDDTFDKFGTRRPQAPIAGRMLGWSVHHAPNVRRPADNALIGHVRLSTRVRCTFDEVDTAISPAKMHEWPLVVTPPGWNGTHRANVSIQVLQSFAIDSHVMVVNVPGPIHWRYFQFGRRESKRQADGRRSLTFWNILVDSDKNALSRVAEEPQPDVKWVNEGGAFMNFVEVDSNTVDVECEAWARCEDDLHARQLFITWVQFACRWSQGIMSSNLIEAGS